MDISTTADKQAGQVRLSCGCVIDPPDRGAPLRVIKGCPAMQTAYEQHLETQKQIRFGDAASRSRAEAAWLAVVAHVRREGRKPKTKAGRDGA